MSTVDKLNKVIKNDQIYIWSTKVIALCYLYVQVLYVTYSSLNKPTFKYSYWKKIHKMFLWESIIGN